MPVFLAPSVPRMWEKKGRWWTFFFVVSVFDQCPCASVCSCTHTQQTPLVSWRQMKHWAPLSWTHRTPTVPFASSLCSGFFPAANPSDRRSLTKSHFKDDSRRAPLSCGAAPLWPDPEFSAALYQILEDGLQLKWPLVALAAKKPRKQ